MFKVLISVLLAFSSSTVLASRDNQGRPPRYDDRLEVIQACDESFSYDFQRQQCKDTARSAKTVRYCVSTYNYDYQRFDCMKELDGGDGRPGENLEIMQACQAAFSYDFQRADCRSKAVGDGHAVTACAKAFNYDYQRFDCIETARSGRLVEYCTTKYSYDFQKFDCLKSGQ